VDRKQKSEVVEDLKNIFTESGVVIVARYKGLSVAQMTTLRNRMREADAHIKVAKNRHAKIAMVDTPCSKIADLLTDQTAIAYSKDPVAAPKIIAKFSEENENLIIIGGSMGEVLLNESSVKALATMPSLDEIRGKIVGLLQAPATKVARVIATPATNVARVLSAYAEK
jgi:large subunit ribosomal protein L10